MKKGKIIAACAGVLLVAAAAGCLLVLHRNGVFEVATPAASSKGGYLFAILRGTNRSRNGFISPSARMAIILRRSMAIILSLRKRRAPVLCGTLICFKGKMALTTFLQPI